MFFYLLKQIKMIILYNQVIKNKVEIKKSLLTYPYNFYKI